MISIIGGRQKDSEVASFINILRGSRRPEGNPFFNGSFDDGVSVGLSIFFQ